MHASEAERSGRSPSQVGSSPLGHWTATLAARTIDVLLVDDEAPIREGLVEFLSNEGYTVTTCANGAEALEFLRSGAPPSLILLDLMMPVMDGWRFRVEQKKDPRLADIPVIVFSANTTSQAQAIDATAFIRKPLDLDELHRSMDDVLARVRIEQVEHADRLATLGTLTAAVAHEIGNPLTYVLANLDEIANELPRLLPDRSTQIPEMLEEARDGARRIAEIVHQIQAVARVVPHHDPRPVALPDVVHGALKIVEHEIRGHARLTLDLRPVPPVAADQARLEQVVLNLLTNAAHAVAERPGCEHEIAVRTSAVGNERVRLEIADDGPGIPPAIGKRIFEPFFTTKPIGVGTGLGLAICRAIVEEAHGEIGFDRRPRGGVVFWIELPSLRSEETRNGLV